MYVSGIEFSLLEVVLWVAVAVQLPRLASRIPALFRSRRMVQFMLAFASVLVALLLSAAKAEAWEPVAKAVLKWTEIGVLAMAIACLAKSRRPYRRLWWLLALASLYGIAAATVSTLGTGVRYAMLRRLPGYAGASLFALALPLWGSGGTIGPAALATLGALCALVSLSRGAWIAVGAVAAYWIVWGRGAAWRRFAAVALVLSTLCLPVLLPALREALAEKTASSLSAASASNEERWGMALLAVRAFLDNPATGIGAESFASFLLSAGEGVPPAFVHAAEPGILTPHNFVLQVLAETGVAGFVAWAAFLGIPLSSLLRGRQRLLAGDPLLLYTDGLVAYLLVAGVRLMLGYVSGAMRAELALAMGLCLASLPLAHCSFGRNDPRQALSSGLRVCKAQAFR